jgi:hypothetical protein
MTAAPETADRHHEDVVHTQVDYLPATEPFKKSYDDESVLTTVRSESMAFFMVADHKDRDQHEFFLVFRGSRITNLSQTLEQLLGNDEGHASFDLVEQITPGAA